MGELDGLQQNSDPKTSFAARKVGALKAQLDFFSLLDIYCCVFHLGMEISAQAVRFFSQEMEIGGSWLRGQKQSEVSSRRWKKQENQQQNHLGGKSAGKESTSGEIDRLGFFTFC